MLLQSFWLRGVKCLEIKLCCVCTNTKFNAKLPGQKDLPPTGSEATGVAEFTPSGESVSCNVNAANIHGVTTKHIHGAE